jgi:hypothetical protein
MFIIFIKDNKKYYELYCITSKLVNEKKLIIFIYKNYFDSIYTKFKLTMKFLNTHIY